MTQGISRRRLLGVAGAALAAPGLVRPAGAQAVWPARPIRLICASSPGGTMDLTLRGVQPGLAAAGVKTQLDYVPGGGGNIARMQLIHGGADGYTMAGEYTPSAALSAILPNAGYSLADLVPVFGWAIEGWAISTRKGGPLKTLADLQAEGKKRAISAGTIGRGTGSHLQLILLRDALGIQMNMVHFAGSSQVYPQVIGGNIDIGCGGPGSGSRSADNLQFLTVFRDAEPALPGVASAKSQGFTVESVDQVYYAHVGKGVAEERLARLDAAFAEAFKDPSFADAQRKAGLADVQAFPRAKLTAMVNQGGALGEKYKAELVG